MEFITSRILLQPTDPERALHFYESVLELAIYREWEMGDTRGVVFFLGGGGLLEVSGKGDQAPSPATKLVLQVRDVHATHELLSGRGVEFTGPPELQPWGLLEMTTHDPDGLELIFVEIPAEHPRRRG